MTTNFDIDDIQFCDNTAKESVEAKAQVQAIIDAMQARIDKLEAEQTRLNKIIHAVEVASRRKLKMNENVWDIISDVQSALESA